MEFLSYCGGLFEFQSLIAMYGKQVISKHTSGFLRSRLYCNSFCADKGSIICHCLYNFYMIYYE